MTKLNIKSTPMIYSPGMFRWIMANEPKQQRKLLEAFGIPAEYIKPIMAGKYKAAQDGETLVLTVEA